MVPATEFTTADTAAASPVPDEDAQCNKVAEVHDVVPQVETPIRTVGVKSLVPKLNPSAVRIPADDAGALRGITDVTIGAS
jgi:hypothetical protein